jgi:23S rRNA (uracil1939-C5)-methyltransferase
MLAAGTLLELVIDKPAAGGRMIARHDGQVVFVRGAIPGERVLALVDKTARGTAFADVTKVLDASPDRRPVPGDPRCGGNAFVHIAYPRQLDLKSAIVADAFARIARLAVPGGLHVRPSPEDGYRLRARLHVKGGRAGFYLEGTHAICDPGPTGQLMPGALAAIAALTPRLAGVSGVEIAENLAGDQRAVHLDFEAPPPVDDLCRAIGGRPEITGLSCSVRGSAATQLLAGSATVFDPLEKIVAAEAAVPPGAILQRHVRAFFQGNRFLVRDLVGAVTTRLVDGVVVDLYAGVGLFAVGAAATGRGRIVAVEGDRANTVDLAANAAPFGGRITVAADAVEHYLKASPPPRGATVVVDPPRTGLSPSALEGILACTPARIVYVSCDVATLARDASGLSRAGYRLDGLEAFDLFPNTAHIETVAVLDREA